MNAGRHCVACEKPGGDPQNIYDGNSFVGRVYVHANCLAWGRKHPSGRIMAKIKAAAAANLAFHTERHTERNKASST